MSTSTQTPPLSPGVGHVILVVHHLPDTDLCDTFYLEVPIHIATNICFIRAKYLASLGFAILNVGRTPQRVPEEPLWILQSLSRVSSTSSYQINPTLLSRAIANTECIQRASGRTEASAEFLDDVRKLHRVCPFTRAPPDICQAAHIFPGARGSEGFHGMTTSKTAQRQPSKHPSARSKAIAPCCGSGHRRLYGCPEHLYSIREMPATRLHGSSVTRSVWMGWLGISMSWSCTTWTEMLARSCSGAYEAAETKMKTFRSQTK